MVLWDQDDRRNSRTGGEKVRDRLRRVRDELEGLGRTGEGGRAERESAESFLHHPETVSGVEGVSLT